MKPSGKNPGLKGNFHSDELVENLLEKIVDVPKFQRLLDHFQRITAASFTIVDLRDKVLVQAGGQDICTRFHERHPQTRSHCLESHDFLIRNVREGEYLEYRCGNQLWEVVTPIIVSEKPVGYFFLGQFFYEDEIPDISCFQQQADHFGFDRNAYLDALNRVPRWSREKVRWIMEFFVQLISMITHLSHTNLQRAAEIRTLRRTEETLEENLRKHRNLVENLTDWVWELSRDGEFSFVGPQVRDLLGYQPEELIGKNLFDLMPEPERARARSSFQQIWKKKLPFGCLESTVLHKDGHRVVLEASGTPFFNQKNHFSGYLGVSRDITDSQQAEERLRRREATLKAILKASPIGIGVVRDQVFRWASDFFLQSMGYAAEEFNGQSTRILYENDEEYERAGRLLQQEICQKGFGAVETRFRKKDGGLIDIYFSGASIDPNNPSAAICVAAMDITERKRYEQKMEHKATHDALTDLPNRLLLVDRINQSVFYAARSRRNVAILLLDLDRFKRINDTMGHSAGDLLLKTISHRLSASVRSCDTVARFGGDEFVIVLAEVAGLEDIGMVTRKILRNLTQPVTIQDQDLEINTSIGISIFPQDGHEPEDLVQKADLAMYQAKQSGGNTFRYFSPEMTVKAQEMLTVEAGLREALRKGEFLLHYQPKVDIRSGRISGCEALVRWQHPQRGLLAPVFFIPVAEETGLILPLGAWVLQEALRQAMAWQQEEVPHCQISVNVSARQFREPGFVRQLGDLLQQTGADPGMISLELTESVILQDFPGALKILAQFRELGISLQLDDFGTGF
ncbi:MAG: diguanylate cyclase, partial [Deltaproteobacteria bacterium]|nr:diguanylate cyclase [Deltaproteobacteria bacterium]